MIEEFDSAKCYLGKLCPKGHEWENTNKSLRYRSSCGCVRCDGTKSIPISTAQRFWNRVDKSGDCWLWFGGKLNGYGRFSLNDRTYFAHRIAWELTYEKIPKNLFICHKCDVKACVRPSHLFLGTSAENTKDMMNKGRNSRGGKTGTSKLTEGQVIQMREMHSKKEKTCREIAAYFNVSVTQFYRIVNRKSWGHIP